MALTKNIINAFSITNNSSSKKLKQSIVSRISKINSAKKTIPDRTVFSQAIIPDTILCPTMGFLILIVQFLIIYINFSTGKCCL